MQNNVSYAALNAFAGRLNPSSHVASGPGSADAQVIVERQVLAFEQAVGHHAEPGLVRAVDDVVPVVGDDRSSRPAALPASRSTPASTSSRSRRTTAPPRPSTSTRSRSTSSRPTSAPPGAEELQRPVARPRSSSPVTPPGQPWLISPAVKEELQADPHGVTSPAATVDRAPPVPEHHPPSTKGRRRTPLGPNRRAVGE
jgi:hypothetical protein